MDGVRVYFLKNKYLATLFLCICILLITILTIDYKFSGIKSADSFMYMKCKKVWAHRRNSILAYKEAIKLGASGIESDVFYDTKLDNFVVSHNFPYSLENEKKLLLQDVFGEFGERSFYWLDFKNLKDLSFSNAGHAIKKLQRLINEYKVQNKIIIESKNPLNLEKATSQNISTSYWVNFDVFYNLGEKSKAVGDIGVWMYTYLIKVLYLLDYFSAISMDYRTYSDELKESLGSIPILLFTVNSATDITRYIDDDSVYIILTDENFYNKKATDC